VPDIAIDTQWGQLGAEERGRYIEALYEWLDWVVEHEGSCPDCQKERLCGDLRRRHLELVRLEMKLRYPCKE